MDHDTVLPAQTVVVQGTRITAVGPTSQVAVPAGAQRIDGTSRYLMPGLADMHAHVVSPGTATPERRSSVRTSRTW
ncbi:MAG TPA: hypothetical protein VF746_21825 [Longimicrobium sp.]